VNDAIRLDEARRVLYCPGGAFSAHLVASGAFATHSNGGGIAPASISIGIFRERRAISTVHCNMSDP